MSKKGIFIIIVTIALLGAGFFMLTQNAPESSREKLGSYQRPPLQGELQYLIFITPEKGVYEGSRDETFAIIDGDVAAVIERIGVVGDGKSRQLGFLLMIPPWMLELGRPGKMEQVIQEGFRVARNRNVAVYFSIESHYSWDYRPDLWNWFDPQKTGYNSANKNNVEWIDWEGTPAKARYLDYGVPERLVGPHMCYNSQKIKSEIFRLVSRIIAPAVKSGMDDLKKEGKGHLFAGITVTSEPSLDNYEGIEKFSPGIAKLMEQNGDPKVRLGYCALTNAGYSKTNPPNDFPQALAKINQEFTQYWAKQFVDAGIPSSYLYTHVAAGADLPGSPALKFTNAPIWTAFNGYSRPGWTTYPVGPLEKNFDALYGELAKNGNPPWGGTEANPFGGVSPETYLSWHFDYGAALVVMNSGASGELADELNEAMWSKKAIAAYRKFLSGK